MANLKYHMDKAGILGVILSHLCCVGIGANISFFAAIGAGFLMSNAVRMPIVTISLIVSMLGIFISYLRHRNIFPFVISVISSVAILVFSFAMRLDILVYAGIAGLIGASGYNYLCLKRCTTAERKCGNPNK